MTPVTLTLQVTSENAAVVSKFLLDLFPTEGAPTIPAPVMEAPKTTKPKPRTSAETKPANEPNTEAEPEAVSETTSEPPTSKLVTLSDVREKALLLSKAGKQEALKALFKKHGGARLTEIDEAAYPTLLADLEAEING